MNVGANRQLAAEHGARYLDNTYGKILGDFCFITAVSAATISVSGGNITDATSVTLAQGQTIRGRYTEVSASSGAVVCYYSRYPVSGGIYTASTFPADDFLLQSQFGPNNTTVPSGTSVSSSLGKTISAVATTSMLTRVQGSSAGQWNGNFTIGEALLYSFGNTEMSFSFASPVRGVGFQIQSSAIGQFAANYKFKDSSSNPIATMYGFGFSNRKSDGSALFLGYESSTQNISSVSIDLSEVVKLNKFAVGKLYIKT
jgi:hypothetical protein